MSRSLILVSLLACAAGCPGGGSSPLDKPDAATAQPDAPKQPPSPDAQLLGYGQTCTSPNQCASGLCVGEATNPHICSIPCSLAVANSCRDVDAFCVPIDNGDAACYGSIETLNDLDDAIVSIGDSVSRAVTPLNDADLFQVQLNLLGLTRFTVTPDPSIDVKLEAYDVLGSPIGFANNVGPGMPESLQTDVQQIGGHIFLVVRNVGASTGGYTFSVAHISPVAPSDAPVARFGVLHAD